jgi:hypothetical protein
MPRYRITTLVDITRTDAVKTEPDQLKILQQNNFNTLRQAIELRSNVSWTRDPERSDGRLPQELGGRAAHWRWEFEVEREELFLKDDDPVGLLKDDLDSVPIITGLSETAEIKPAAFQTKGQSINIIVEII